MDLYYTVKGVSVAQLSTKIDEMWTELQNPDSQLNRRAIQLGIDVHSVANLDSSDAVKIRREGSGFDPATTALVVSFAPVAAQIISDLWNQVILPRLLRDEGQDKILPRKK